MKPGQLFPNHAPISTGQKRFGPIGYRWDDGGPGIYRAVAIRLGRVRIDLSIEVGG